MPIFTKSKENKEIGIDIRYEKKSLSGDLAIEVTSQYRQVFGENEKIGDYQKVSQFLLESRMMTDLNKLLIHTIFLLIKYIREKSFLLLKKICTGYAK